ncbi:hypothetical protein DF186_19205, partial [Enterococcus hirae]
MCDISRSPARAGAARRRDAAPASASAASSRRQGLKGLHALAQGAVEVGGGRGKHRLLLELRQAAGQPAHGFAVIAGPDHAL